MTTDSTAHPTHAPTGGEPPAAAPELTARTLRATFGFGNIGAIWVLLLQIVLFSVWLPDVFPTAATAKQILNSNAGIALAALALVVPLTARVFDLSFAYTMSLSGVTVAYLMVHTGMGLPAAIGIALLAALLVGVINAIVVVVLGVESLIGTLGTGSIIQALITFVTKDISITDDRLTGSFTSIGQTDVGGIVLPVFYAVLAAAATWYVLEHTATGRRLYAAGFNADAARLAGVRVERLRFLSLIASSLIAGFAGIVLASNLGSGSPTAGTPYLLPAFAAVFLGATQFKHGRFNAWGTLTAVLMLGTGLTGLALGSAPPWASNMFTGVVLIAALASSGVQRRTRLRGRRAP
ncbi:ABC transporter permease [Streptomyces adelaidensis]|uniref:ABC transporter permease n=1 Tax=Streptomyces adelaidensis TaxID=2796465 RepID=UPI001906FC01|nr:ABC transporter permease [Streptomyces adelaidensis]